MPHIIFVPRRTLPIWVVVVVVVAVAATLWLRQPSPTQRLVGQAPGLAEDLATHLLHDTPDQLDAHCADLDAQQLLEAAAALSAGLDTSSPAAFTRSREQLLPPLARLAAILEARGHSAGPRMLVDYLQSAPENEAFRVCRHQAEVGQLCADQSLSPEARHAAVLALADSVSSCRPFAAYVESRLLELAADAGRHDAKRHHLGRAIALARASGQFPLLSQLLGTLCDDRLDAGQRDSALVLADQALDVALNAGLPLQAARIHFILGADHDNRGEISLASERFDAAVGVARRFNAAHVELRFLLAQLRFQARLGCWDLVGRSLPRLELLADRMPDHGAGPARRSLEVAALRLQAGHASQAGRPGAADSLYTRARRLARDLPRTYVVADVLAEWTAWLLDRDRPARAVALAHDGLAIARDRGLERHIRTFHSILARGLLVQGAVDDARAHVTASLAVGPRDAAESFADAVLGLRLAIATDDSVASVGLADVALAHLMAAVGQWGHRAERYLQMHQHGFFRELILAHLARDDTDALALELAWRDLPGFVAEHGGTAVGLAEFREHGRRRCQDLQRWSVTSGVPVLIFGESRHELWRWQLRGSELHRQTLALSPGAAELEALSRLLGEFGPAARPPFGWPQMLKDRLIATGRKLLPDWIHDGHGRLLVATTPALRGIPLEALGLATDDDDRFVHLASSWQLAYIGRRGAHLADQPRDPGACVVGIPQPTRALRRRQPHLTALPRVEAEVRHAATALPGARLLTGTGARKADITAAMAAAGVIYLAGHATEDPEMPYRTFIPCAAHPDSADPGHARLEVSDILALDLSGCGMAVLSNCRSGARRATRHTVGPSLADAFIDAGAGCVLATRYPVADVRAEADMARFLDAWQGGDGWQAWEALARLDDSDEVLPAWMLYRLEFGKLPTPTSR